MAYQWQSKQERLAFAEYVIANRDSYTYDEIGNVWAAEHRKTDAPNRNQAAAAQRDVHKLRQRISGSAPASTREGDDRRAKGVTKLSHETERDTSAERVNVEWTNLQPAPDSERFDLDAWLEQADRRGAAMDKRDPVRLVGTMRIDTDGPIAIRFFSCFHLGGRYTDHARGIKLLREVLAVPNVYIVSLGDDIDGFHARFVDVEAVHNNQEPLGDQENAWQAVLDELTADGRLLWGHAGQHSGDWFIRHYGYNPIKRAYMEHDCQYFDGQAYVRLEVGEQIYHIAAAHQFPGNSIYNPLHPHTRALRWHFPMADVVVMGDKHHYAMSELEPYPFENMIGNRRGSLVHLIQVGTAKTGPDKYTTKRFPPGSLVWPVVVFDSNKHKVHKGATMEDALKWLAPTGAGVR